MMAPRVRVGVVGIGRGLWLGERAAAGFELVAVCDTDEAGLRDVGRRLGVATYTEYSRFLEHDMDAVLLANNFHEHAPFAIKALAADKHVMSETAACHTLAEAVALIEAVEASDRVYLFAENYPYMAFNQEMRRRYRAGDIGEFRYGEGEYVHPDPAAVKLARSRGYDHWRNWIPATYYCTHSVGPVMFITGTRPEKVNGFVIPFDANDPTMAHSAKIQDTAATIICRMSGGAVVKSLHGGLRGHGNYVRIHGNRGLMENGRHGDKQRLRIWREPWETPVGESSEIVYRPTFPHYHEEATAAGHGGADFFTLRAFLDAIRTGEPPEIDVYLGVDMSIVGIQAWRSVLADSAPVEVPDLRDRALRVRYADDHWSPDPARSMPGQPPSSVLGRFEPGAEARALADKVWSDA
ncbi:MAG: hypothetical protein CMQ24_11715 [Gammaproteobacteria bacterium]|nr:hypothetical protein [Gammaproteobacteria bacterium]